jgi:hypothetical protein
MPASYESHHRVVRKARVASLKVKYIVRLRALQRLKDGYQAVETGLSKAEEIVCAFPFSRVVGKVGFVLLDSTSFL